MNRLPWITMLFLTLGFHMELRSAPPGGNPPPVQINIIEAYADYYPGTPPTADGGCIFTGAANTQYKVLLLAAPVSGTNPQNAYVVVSNVVLTTDADGNGSVTGQDLKGNLPLATQGWWVRIGVAAMDGSGATAFTDPEYFSIN